MVFEAVGDDGLVADVEVRLANQVLTTQLDGMPIEVPVGLSEFTFTRGSGERKSLRVLLRQGETNRIVSVDFRSPPASALQTAPPALELIARRPIPTSVWLFGTATLVAVTAGATLGTIAKVKESEAGGTCAPDCADSVVSEIKDFALAADVSFGLAIAAGVTTTILYFGRPTVMVPRDGPTAGLGRDRRSASITPAPVRLSERRLARCPRAIPMRNHAPTLVLLGLGCASLGSCSLTIDETGLSGADLHCSETRKQCDLDGQAECVPLSSPDFGCSSVACAPCYLNKATATCSPATGECIIATCIGSWENCDGNEANGCETDTNTDADHCSDCDDPCPERAHADIRCGSARCYIRVCEDGFGDCNEELADGCETHLLTSEAHCGECGAPCPGRCSEGTCVPQ